MSRSQRTESFQNGIDLMDEEELCPITLQPIRPHEQSVVWVETLGSGRPLPGLAGRFIGYDYKSYKRWLQNHADPLTSLDPVIRRPVGELNLYYSDRSTWPDTRPFEIEQRQQVMCAQKVVLSGLVIVDLALIMSFPLGPAVAGPMLLTGFGVSILGLIGVCLQS